MERNRRDLLLMSTAGAGACLAAPKALAIPLHTDSKLAVEALYGATTKTPVSHAQALLGFQNVRTAAPTNAIAFGDYVEGLPLFRSLQAQAQAGQTPNDLYVLAQWSHLALDMVALDHTFYKDIEAANDTSYAEQFGAPRSSRALAIIHIAMTEAVNFVYRSHTSYKDIRNVIQSITGLDASSADPKSVSVPLAISWAAFGAVAAVYPYKAPLAKECLSRMLGAVRQAGADDAAQQRGTLIGQAAARATLLARSYDFGSGAFRDGSRDGKQLAHPDLDSLSLEPDYPDVFTAPTVNDWQIDPISQLPVALGGSWEDVEPFVLNKSAAGGLFLPGGVPAFGGPGFNAALAQVHDLGGDDQPPEGGDKLRWRTPTSRTGSSPDAPLDETNQTFKARFWGYDAAAYVGSSPRLYAMIATSVALSDPSGRFSKSAADLARYLAVVTTALADAAIGAWTAKYRFHLASPVGWIRNHQPADPANARWTPLGQVATNQSPSSRNATPPYPPYPSGHAVLGAALFGAMRGLFGLAPDADGPAFAFVSDEYNGFNAGADGIVRPRVERSFESFAAAERENGQSRVWLGVNWPFAVDDGVRQGRAIGTFVATNAFQPA